MWEQIKHGLDWAALGVVFATLAQWLPAVAAILSIIWGFYRIKEIRLDIAIKEQRLKGK